jgi:predicted enzyme related to lactoylglutathione lyase
MSEPAYNSVGWFEIGTDDPESAERFYGELFGWTFRKDDSDPNMEYREVTAPGAELPSGGIMSTGGKFPNYATFYVVVEDVAATVAKAERLGGKVLVPPTTVPAGLVFAQVHDPAGNQIGIFTPAPTT